MEMPIGVDWRNRVAIRRMCAWRFAVVSRVLAPVAKGKL